MRKFPQPWKYLHLLITLLSIYSSFSARQEKRLRGKSDQLSLLAVIRLAIFGSLARFLLPAKAGIAFTDGMVSLWRDQILLLCLPVLCDEDRGKPTHEDHAN
ncbi:MAG: hypothetical protein IMW89_17065 [Ktedonobacteraceae bacterium]|nr:hypothetical protein [Ktedonobacteraceae bacterium]